MVNIALILTHNKTVAGNRNQITAVANRLTEATELLWTYDQDGNQIPLLDEETGLQATRKIGYTINNLNIPHLCKVYQIIPFGVAQPNNLYTIDSHKVFYGAGDEDKTGTHPRFFNWGLKRATDYGADVVLDLHTASSFSETDARTKIEILASLTDPHIFYEGSYSRLSSLRLLRNVGQLNEGLNLTDALTDLKTRIQARGYQYG